MAKAIKDAVAEKIELLDQLDGITRHRSYKFWWIGAAVLALATTTCAFFLVRRRLNLAEK
jgi:hypothetical protein